MMTETLTSRLVRLVQDVDIYRVDIVYKCKTVDGMIYTLDVTEFYRNQLPEGMDYAEWVDGVSAHQLLRLMGIIEDGKGFYASLHENVAVRKDQIVRIWLELGDAYSDGPIK